MKVKLERHAPPKHDFERDMQRSASIITFALPFYKPKAGTYIHRVRRGTLHRYEYPPFSHTSLEMWCGHIGGLYKGELFDKPPERAVHCAICEGKAIGAGMDGAREICGRTVLFQPRT